MPEINWTNRDIRDIIVLKKGMAQEHLYDDCISPGILFHILCYN